LSGKLYNNTPISAWLLIAKRYGKQNGFHLNAEVNRSIEVIQ